jgi:hypothetical protein
MAKRMVKEKEVVAAADLQEEVEKGQAEKQIQATKYLLHPRRNAPSELCCFVLLIQTQLKMTEVTTFKFFLSPSKDSSPRKVRRSQIAI